MSLINEALKKAQRDRAGSGSTETPGGSGPGDGGGSQHQPASSGRPRGLIGLIVGGVIGCAVAAFVIMQFLGKPEAPPAAAKAPVVAAAPEPAAPATAAALAATTPAPATTTPVATAATAPAAEPAATPPTPAATAASTTAPAATTAATQAAKPEPAPATVATTTPPAAPPAAPAAEEPAKQDRRILAFVDAVRVTGIRQAGRESKVLMNDRVFRIGDLVDIPLGLKLSAVAAHQLTFTDEKGNDYVKNF